MHPRDSSRPQINSASNAFNGLIWISLALPLCTALHSAVPSCLLSIHAVLFSSAKEFLMKKGRNGQLAWPAVKMTQSKMSPGQSSARVIGTAPKSCKAAADKKDVR